MTGLSSFLYNAGVLLEKYIEIPSAVVICQGYVSIRDSSLYVALLHMVLFSIERWRSVHHPFQYIRQRSKTKALVTIIIIWLFGFSVHTIIICYWAQFQPELRHEGSVRETPVFNSSLFMSAEHDHLSEYINNASQTTTIGEHQSVNISQTSLPSHRGGELRNCHAPYAEHIVFTAVGSALHYVLIILAILAVNLSAYTKALSRKKLRIRRSVSSGDVPDQMLLPAAVRAKWRRSPRPSIRLQQGTESLETSLEHGRKLSDASCISMQSQNSSLDTSTTLLTDNRSHRYSRYTDNFVFVKRGFPKRPTLLKSVSEVIGVTADQRLIPRDEVRRRASSPAGTFRKIISSDSRLTSRNTSNAELAQNLLERQDRGAACWLLILCLRYVYFCSSYRTDSSSC